MGRHPSWPPTRPSLLAELRDGRAFDAWKTFVETYSPAVFHYCRKKGLPPEDAEEVTQAVMLKVQRFEYRPERGRFHSWLATVTGRAVGRLRKKGRLPGNGAVTDETAEVADPKGNDPDWQGVLKAHVLERALERVRPEFNDEQWRAFEAVALRVVEQDGERRVVWAENGSAERVARDLGRRAGWVHQVKARVYARLRQEVLYLAEDLTPFS